MKYLAVLGRQPKISLAELEALFGKVQPLRGELAEFEAEALPDIHRLGGTQKLAQEITGPVMEYLKNLPRSHKITLGVSDYSRHTSPYEAQKIALKLKRLLVKNGYSVRIVPNKTAALSSAVSFHNHLFLKNKIELIKLGNRYFRVFGVQDINAYVKRDRERPARDAKVGMLPPKLAQILINLCGNLHERSFLLDPFCGTGVVLQEAALMGYIVQGTDINERMVEYTNKNLKWVWAHDKLRAPYLDEFLVEQGDATNHTWKEPINAVACEVYLGTPMSTPPTDIKLKQEEQECGGIIHGFLKNLARQISSGTPVVIAVPAWLRSDGGYKRLNLLDEIENLGYNVMSFKNLEQDDLLYHRVGQIVAREIIVLRKK